MSNLVGLGKSAALVTKCLLLWSAFGYFVNIYIYMKKKERQGSLGLFWVKTLPLDNRNRSSSFYLSCRITIKTIYGQHKDIH